MSLHLLGELLAKNEENKKLQQFIKKADKQADKLTDLVDDLMDITRINEGKLNIRRNKFNLKEAISESIEGLTLPLKSNILVNGETEVEAYADKTRIQQVITNYITNAIKYSPVVADVTVTIQQNEKQIKVLVTDKGIGIPEDTLDKVFDRYYRVNESAKQFAGLGLGLYISKEIIKKHGGEVGVTSELGKGSTFWFCLPVK